MYIFKALAVLLVIIFAESVHGTLRQLFLAPLIGDLRRGESRFLLPCC
jgi:hypothetical protein